MQSTPAVRKFNETLGGILRVLHYNVYTLTYDTRQGDCMAFEYSSEKAILDSISDEINNLDELQKQTKSDKLQAEKWGSAALYADMKNVRELCATSNSKIEKKIGQQTQTGKTAGGQRPTFLSKMAPETRRDFSNKNKIIQEKLTVLIEDYEKQSLVHNRVEQPTNTTKNLHDLLEQAISDMEGAQMETNMGKSIDQMYWRSLNSLQTLQPKLTDSVFNGCTQEQLFPIKDLIDTLQNDLKKLYETLLTKLKKAQESHERTLYIRRKNADSRLKKQWENLSREETTKINTIETSMAKINACQEALTRLTNRFESEPPTSFGVRYL